MLLDHIRGVNDDEVCNFYFSFTFFLCQLKSGLLIVVSA